MGTFASWESNPASELGNHSESAWLSENRFLEVERDYISQIEELHPDTWIGLSDAERVRGLQELENRLAEIDGRPPVEVRVASLPVSECGYYDRETGSVVLSARSIVDSQPFKAVETVAHEGRYAYHDYAMQHVGVHQNAHEVDSWRANVKNFLSVAQFGYELYQTQPLVADALNYAAAVAAEVVQAVL